MCAIKIFWGSITYKVTFILIEAKGQCDKMAILFFNICPLLTVKMCPIALKNLQRRLRLEKNEKDIVKNRRLLRLEKE